MLRPVADSGRWPFVNDLASGLAEAAINGPREFPGFRRKGRRNFTETGARLQNLQPGLPGTRQNLAQEGYSGRLPAQPTVQRLHVGEGIRDLARSSFARIDHLVDGNPFHVRTRTCFTM